MPRKRNEAMTMNLNEKGEVSLMQGLVVWFDNAKGYGFIKATTTGDEYFAHHSEIEMEGYRTLKPEQAVEFLVEMGPKGRMQAVNVKVVSK